MKAKMNMTIDNTIFDFEDERFLVFVEPQVDDIMNYVVILYDKDKDREVASQTIARHKYVENAVEELKRVKQDFNKSIEEYLKNEK